MSGSFEVGMVTVLAERPSHEARTTIGTGSAQGPRMTFVLSPDSASISRILAASSVLATPSLTTVAETATEPGEPPEPAVGLADTSASMRSVPKCSEPRLDQIGGPISTTVGASCDSPVRLGDELADGMFRVTGHRTTFGVVVCEQTGHSGHQPGLHPSGWEDDGLEWFAKSPKTSDSSAGTPPLRTARLAASLAWTARRAEACRMAARRAARRAS